MRTLTDPLEGFLKIFDGRPKIKTAGVQYEPSGARKLIVTVEGKLIGGEEVSFNGLVGFGVVAVCHLERLE